MKNFFIDIETVPSQNPAVKEAIAETITHPGNISKPETIAKWHEEKKPIAVEEKWRNTALDATKGELLCIGFAGDNDDARCLGREIETPESVLLNEINDSFARILSGSKPVWVGHYITGFDLRFLWLRFVINGIKPAFEIPYNAKPWDDNVFDTKIEWAGLNTPVSGSLNDVCLALGLEGKGDINGSKVWDYVVEGRYEEIFEYAKDDVNRARNVYRRMNFL